MSEKILTVKELREFRESGPSKEEREAMLKKATEFYLRHQGKMTLGEGTAYRSEIARIRDSIRVEGMWKDT